MADENVIQVGVRVDTGQLKSGMEEGAGAVKASTDRMQQAFDSLAQATITSVGAQNRLRDAIKQVEQGTIQGSTAVKILSAELRDAAAAADQLAAAKKNVSSATVENTTATVAETAAEKIEAVAANESAAAHVNQARSLTEARLAAQLLGREIGVTMPRALTTVLARSETLGPVFNTAFNAIAAVGFALILAQIADKLSELIADTLIYTDAMKAAFQQQITANQQILDALNKQKGAEEEHFKNVHNGVENVLHDLDAENQHRKDLTQQITAQEQKLKELQALQGKNVLLRQGKFVESFNQEPDEQGSLVKEKFDAALADTAASLAVLKAQAGQADAAVVVLNDHLKDQKDKALKEAADQAKRLAAEARQADQQQVRDWEDQLTQRAIAAGAFHEQSKSDEAAFWKDILDNQKLSTQQRQEIDRKYKDALFASQREALADQVAGIKEQISAEEHGSATAVSLYAEVYNAIAKAYGEGSKEAQRALGELNRAVEANTKKVEEEQKKQQQKDRELAAEHLKTSYDAFAADIDLQIMRVKSMAQLGDINAKQEAQQLEDLLARKLKAEENYLARKRALYAGDADAQAKIDDQIVKADGKAKSEMERAAEESAKKQQEVYKQAFDGVFSAMQTAINGFIQGTQSFGQALQKMLTGALVNEAEYLVRSRLQKAEHYLLDKILHATNLASKQAMTTASNTADVAQTAATETAKTTLREGLLAADTAAQLTAATTISATKIAIFSAEQGVIYSETVATNMAMILSDAAVAAAAAFAATAIIPFIGPELAPAAGAAAYTAVTALAPLASAKGGWEDIPQDTIARVHAHEMILPAHVADTVRANVSGDGGGHHFHFSPTIHAMDSKDVARFLSQHGSSIANRLGSMMRNGNLQSALRRAKA